MSPFHLQSKSRTSWWWYFSFNSQLLKQFKVEWKSGNLLKTCICCASVRKFSREWVKKNIISLSIFLPTCIVHTFKYFRNSFSSCVYVSLRRWFIYKSQKYLSTFRKTEGRGRTVEGGQGAGAGIWGRGEGQSGCPPVQGKSCTPVQIFILFFFAGGQ